MGGPQPLFSGYMVLGGIRKVDKKQVWRTTVGSITVLLGWAIKWKKTFLCPIFIVLVFITLVERKLECILSAWSSVSYGMAE